MAIPKMNYCMQCGSRLVTRHLDLEGDIPYCETCQELRFPIFNTAVSMVVTTQARELLEQLAALDGQPVVQKNKKRPLKDIFR